MHNPLSTRLSCCAIRFPRVSVRSTSRSLVENPSKCLRTAQAGERWAHGERERMNGQEGQQSEARFCAFRQEAHMTPTKLLVGQIFVVFAIVILGPWAATQW